MTRSPVLFFTVLVVGAFLFFATRVSTPGETAAEFRQRIGHSEVQAGTMPEAELDETHLALQGELRSIGENFEGVAGIAVSEVSSGATMAYDGETPFPQQSVSKLWVALTALDLAENGAIDLSERVTIGRGDLTVFYQPVRDIVNRRGSFTTDYRDLLIRAITQSDNTANDRLLRRIGGPQAVEAFLRRNYIESVRFGTDERTKQSRIAGLEWRQSYSVGNAFFEARDKVPEADRMRAFNAYLADPVDSASAAGMAKALARLARGELLGEQGTEFILATMELTKSGPRRLKGGLAEGWTLAHKTGTGQFFDGIQSGYNDVGILTAPDGRRYSVAVLIGRTRAPYADRFEMMQAVTRAVIGYHEQRVD